MRNFLLCLTAVAIVSTSQARAQNARPLSVYWIDVEGGAATLIVTPAGESVLVDAGNPGGRDSGRVLHTAKDLAHLDHVDTLVVTHLHVDHFGGVAEVAAGMPIRTLYENGIEAFRGAPIGKRIVAQPGDRIPLKQAGATPINLRVIGARQKVASGDGARPNAANCHDLVEKPVDTSDNANSISMVLEFGAFRMFLGGDTTWNVEEKLVCPADHVGVVDVYQSVHHGLDLSNNPVLVHTLQPHVVVFNNGARKGNEPNAAATMRATSSVQAIFQMHRSLRPGAINTSDDHIANADEACKGEGIAMTVAPDGKSYTISIPSTGFKETYRAGR
jgi:beta-lactamase superfamily II metal-dependent hydrolase